MENLAIVKKIKNEGVLFFEATAQVNEIIYFVLLTLYVGLYLIIKIAFRAKIGIAVEIIRYGTLSLIMWGSALYLFFVIAAWRNLWNKTIPLIITGGVLLAVTFFFSRWMSTNAYGVVMDIFFCLMAYKKDYRKMLHCILSVTVIMLIIAGVGFSFGLAGDMWKPDTDTPGHSLGIIYPNTWGYLVFLALMITWYLYLRFKPIITFALFWPVSVFMYSYITCRTIAGLTLIFPVFALLVDRLEKKEDQKAAEERFKGNKILEWIIIVIPFLSFAFMLFVSMQYKWVHQFYHGPLRNLAWRFLQGGLYFKTYGLPIVGNPYRSNELTFVNVNGEIIQVGILDSSFATYIIMRGMLWLTYTLLWLCIAHWKALKKRDYAIILIETVFLGFAMMERPGLEMWYNFILLYPLAKVVSKPGTEKVLEFDTPCEAVSAEIVSSEPISAGTSEDNL